MVVDYFICQKCKTKRAREEFISGTGIMYQCPVCDSTDIDPELNAVEYNKLVNEENKKSNNHGEVKIMSVQDILEFKLPDTFLIEGVLYPNTVNNIISEYSGFKSILSMYMALSVSQGLPWFGYKTDKGPVLIIDNENNIQELKLRYEALMAGNPDYKKENIDIHYMIREGKLDNPEFAQTVREYILDHKIKLVILDTLLRMHNMEENSSKEMNMLYDVFCSFLINNCSVLYLHHTNKKGLARGTGDILGQVDCGFSIVRPDKLGPKFYLTNDKNRFGEIDPIEGTVEWDKPTNVAVIEGVNIPKDKTKKEEATKFEEARQYIMSYADVNKTFKSIDLSIDVEAYNADHPDNIISKYAIKRAMTWLKKKKKIADGVKRGTLTLIEDGENTTLDEFNEVEE